MPSLKEVRNRISSVKSTQQITKAMKMVAAAKLRRAQESIERMRPYAQMLEGILNNLAGSTPPEELDSPYLQERNPEKILIVSLTSDRGLCGAFNMNVIKATNKLIQKKYATQLEAGNVHFLPIGKKGKDYLISRHKNLNADYNEIFQNLSFEEVKAAGDYILNAFAKGEYDRVEIVFNEFKNVATQIMRTEQFLPIQQMEVEENDTSSEVDYLLEPSKEEIITELIPTTLKIKLYRAILESNASEQGARMMAMDNATENAGELISQLKLQYNRSRQAAITKEILEIVGGAEALNAN